MPGLNLTDDPQNAWDFSRAMLKDTPFGSGGSTGGVVPGAAYIGEYNMLVDQWVNRKSIAAHNEEAIPALRKKVFAQNTGFEFGLNSEGELGGGSALSTEQHQFNIVEREQNRALYNYTLSEYEDLGLIKEPDQEGGLWTAFRGAWTAMGRTVEVAPNLELPVVGDGLFATLMRQFGTDKAEGALSTWFTLSMTKKQAAINNALALDPELARQHVELASRSEFDGRIKDINFDAQEAVAELARDKMHLFEQGLVIEADLLASPDQDIFDRMVKVGNDIHRYGAAMNNHPIAAFAGGIGGGLQHMLTDPREITLIIAAAVVTEGVGGVLKFGAGLVKGGLTGIRAADKAVKAVKVASAAAKGTRIGGTLATIRTGSLIAKAQTYAWHMPTLATSYTAFDNMIDTTLMGSHDEHWLDGWQENMKMFAVGDLMMFGLIKGTKGGAGLTLRSAGIANDFARVHMTTRGALRASKLLKEQLILLKAKKITVGEYVNQANLLTEGLTPGTRNAVIRSAMPNKHSVSAYISQIKNRVDARAFHTRKSLSDKVKDKDKIVGVTKEGRKARETQSAEVTKGLVEETTDVLGINEAIPVKQYAAMKMAELRTLGKKFGITGKTKKILVDKLEKAHPRVGKSVLQGDIINANALATDIPVGTFVEEHPILTNSLDELDVFLRAFGVKTAVSRARASFEHDILSKVFKDWHPDNAIAGGNANDVVNGFGAFVMKPILKFGQALDRVISQSDLVLRNANYKIGMLGNLIMDVPTASRYQMKNGYHVGTLSFEARVMEARAGMNRVKQRMLLEGEAFHKAGGTKEAFEKEVWSVITERKQGSDVSKEAAAVAAEFKKWRREWFDEGKRMGIFGEDSEKVTSVNWDVEAMQRTVGSGDDWIAIARQEAAMAIRSKPPNWDTGVGINKGFVAWINEKFGVLPKEKQGRALSSKDWAEIETTVQQLSELKRLYADETVLLDYTKWASQNGYDSITGKTLRPVNSPRSEKPTDIWFVDLKKDVWDPFIEKDHLQMMEAYQWSQVPNILETQVLENVTGLSGLTFDALTESLLRDLKFIAHEKFPNDPAAKLKFITESERGIKAALAKRDVVANRGPMGQDTTGELWWMARNANRLTSVGLLPGAGLAALGEIPAVILADGFRLSRFPQLLTGVLRTLWDGNTRRNTNALLAAEEYHSVASRWMFEEAGSSRGVGPNPILRKLDHYSANISRHIVSRMYGLGYVTRFTKTMQTMHVADNLIRNISRLEVYNKELKGGMDHVGALRKAGIEQRDFGLMNKYTVLDEIGTLGEAVSQGLILEKNGFKILDFDRIDAEFPLASTAVRSYRAYINGVTETLTATRTAVSTPTAELARNPIGLMSMSLSTFTLAFTHRLMPYLGQSRVGRQGIFMFSAAGIHMMISALREASRTGDMDGVIRSIEEDPSAWMVKSMSQMPFLGMMNYAGFGVADSIATGNYRETEIPLFGATGAVASYLAQISGTIAKGIEAGASSKVDWTMQDTMRMKRAIPTLSWMPFQWAFNAAGMSEDSRLPGERISVDTQENSFSNWLQTPDGKQHDLDSLMELIDGADEE